MNQDEPRIHKQMVITQSDACRNKDLCMCRESTVLGVVHSVEAQLKAPQGQGTVAPELALKDKWELPVKEGRLGASYQMNQHDLKWKQSQHVKNK